jgi:hypothetical protein
MKYLWKILCTDLAVSCLDSVSVMESNSGANIKNMTLARFCLSFEPDLSHYSPEIHQIINQRYGF